MYHPVSRLISQLAPAFVVLYTRPLVPPLTTLYPLMRAMFDVGAKATSLRARLSSSKLLVHESPPLLVRMIWPVLRTANPFVASRNAMALIVPHHENPIDES